MGLHRCLGLSDAFDGMGCGIVLHRPGQVVPLFYNAVVQELTGVAYGAFGPGTVALMAPRLTAWTLAAMQHYALTFGAGDGHTLRLQFSLYDAEGNERMFYALCDRLWPCSDAPVLTVFDDVELLVMATMDHRLAPLEFTSEQIRAFGTLTQREREVLALMAANLRSEEIAKRLSISPQTVQTHRKNLLCKLGVRSALALAPFVPLLSK